MLRPLLLLLVSLASPVAAEGVGVRHSYAVDEATSARPDPVVRGRVEGWAGRYYGGVRAATIPEPDETADVDVYVGMRPRVGDVAMDFGVTRDVAGACCGGLAADVSRPLGDAARVGARIYFDPDGTAETEARAAVTVARGTRIAGGVGGRFRDADDPSVGFNVGVSRLLAELCRFDLRYRDAIAADRRAEVSLKVGF